MTKRWDDGLPQACKLFRFCGWEIRCQYDDGSKFNRDAGYIPFLTKPSAKAGEPGYGLVTLYKSETELYRTAEMAQYRAIQYVEKIEGIDNE